MPDSRELDDSEVQEELYAMLQLVDVLELLSLISEPQRLLIEVLLFLVHLLVRVSEGRSLSSTGRLLLSA